jgi:hypothetical protein
MVATSLMPINEKISHLQAALAGPSRRADLAVSE